MKAPVLVALFAGLLPLAAAAAFPVGQWEYRAHAQFQGPAYAPVPDAETRRICLREDQTVGVTFPPDATGVLSDSLWVMRGNQLWLRYNYRYGESASDVEAITFTLDRIGDRLMTGSYQAWQLGNAENASTGQLEVRYIGRRCG